MRPLLLVWWVGMVAGQYLESPDGACKEGWQCKKQRHCGPFLDLKDRVDRLQAIYQEGKDESVKLQYEKQLGRLEELVCNRAEEGVCCKESFEVVNGNIVRNVEDFPYIARLSIKNGFASSSRCGASLISSQYLLTAKHCVTKFYDQCLNERDCVAWFRDLVVGRENHEKGQFYIPLVDAFFRSTLIFFEEIQLYDQDLRDSKSTPCKDFFIVRASPATWL